MSLTPVDVVIEKAGGVAALSRALGLTHPTVIGWRRRGQVPPERLEQVAAITGMRPAEIRPDLAKLFAEAEGSAVPARAPGEAA